MRARREERRIRHWRGVGLLYKLDHARRPAKSARTSTLLARSIVPMESAMPLFYICARPCAASEGRCPNLTIASDS